MRPFVEVRCNIPLPGHIRVALDSFIPAGRLGKGAYKNYLSGVLMMDDKIPDFPCDLSRESLAEICLAFVAMIIVLERGQPDPQIARAFFEALRRASHDTAGLPGMTQERREEMDRTVDYLEGLYKNPGILLGLSFPKKKLQ